MGKRSFLIGSGMPVALFLLAVPVLADDDSVPVFKPLTSSSLVIAGKSQGSGFLIDAGDRMMLTNHHVVSRNTTVSVIIPIFQDGRAMNRRDHYLRHGYRMHAKVLDTDEKRDLALLQLGEAPRGLVDLKLATAKPREGERVHMIGNPGKQDKVWVYSIGNVRRVADEKLVYEDGQRVGARVLSLTSDGKMGPGASGGPVVNDAGELLGVICAGKLDGHELSCIDATEVRYFLGTAYRKMATAAIGRTEYIRAVELCDKAVRTFPHDPLTHNERGAALSFLNSLDEAIASYTKALKIDPTLIRAYRNRGSAYFHKGKYEQAVADCSEAIRLSPKYISAYQVRAKAYDKLNRAAEALADHAKAKELSLTSR